MTAAELIAQLQKINEPSFEVFFESVPGDDDHEKDISVGEVSVYYDDEETQFILIRE